MNKKSKIVIGITGYLGSGKSTVLEYFADLGFYPINADKIVHELYKPGRDGWHKIKNYFGDRYISKDGTVDRAKLRREVFNNPVKLRILEKMIHPLVYNEINKILHKTNSSLIVIESVKLDNKKFDFAVTHNIWVNVNKDVAFQRTSKKLNIKYEDFQKIIESQEKPEDIDIEIDNSKGDEELRKTVMEVYKKIVPKDLQV